MPLALPTEMFQILIYKYNSNVYIIMSDSL